MPTYDYVCDECGNRFEEWQKITDQPIAICPLCGGPVHRVIYAVGLVFKGGGFYKTDNRAASAEAASTASNASAAEDGKPADGKPADAKDSKPAKSAEGAGGSEAKASAAGSAMPAKGE
jgi:putative FmdB family regulatory protein